MRQTLLDLVHRNYPGVAKDLLNPLLEMMRLSREHCDGDMDKFLILMVVGVRTLEHPEFAGLSPDELAEGEAAAFPSLGTNVRSVAASIGIPKETVRRKVGELIAAGWFERRGGSLRYTLHAYRQLAPVRESLQQMAVRYFEVVDVLARAG